MVLTNYFLIFGFNFLRTYELNFSMAEYSNYENDCNLLTKVVNPSLTKILRNISTSLLNYEL